MLLMSFVTMQGNQTKIFESHLMGVQSLTWFLMHCVRSVSVCPLCKSVRCTCVSLSAHRNSNGLIKMSKHFNVL